MASATETTKILCVTCNKAKGIFKCEGCSRIFCPKHSIDHRNELGKQLEGIEVTHDLVQQTLTQQTEDTQQHPFLKKIDQWEKESIVKIRQVADEARGELLKGAAQHTVQVKEKLQQVSTELRRGREESDFSEIDLHQWTEKLDDLQKELVNPTTMVLKEDSTTLVSRIRIDRQDSSDIFESVHNTVQITHNGHVAVRDGSNGHVDIRGKNGYNTGRHSYRFRVEQLTLNGWIFLGIISKSEPSKSSSYNSSSSYGWSNRNQVYTPGEYKSKETIEIIQDDTMILTIDCDQRKIELKSERLNRTQELSVDITKCAFPWQLHLNLHAAGTQIRILSSSN